MSWRIFQKWFNLPPWDDAEFFTDDHGKKFWFTWGTHLGLGPKLWVYYYGRWVATVESVWEDDGGLALADIIIFERYKHLRRRGVGKKMFDLFVEKARSEGAHFITGTLMPHEGESFERIYNWYKLQGVQINGSQIYFEL